MSRPAGLKEAYITYAETKGALGLQQISDEFDSLFALSQANQGKQLVNSGINGKSFGFQVDLSVEEKFAVLGEVIRELNGDRIVATYPDFSGLQR